MKKFLALAFAGAMALSVTACGAKEEAAEEAVKEVAEEIEKEVEEETEEVEEAAEEVVEGEEDNTLFGLTYALPEEWEGGNSEDYVWIAAPLLGNKMWLEVFEGDPGDDFDIMGTGKFTSQVEGTEPIEIAPFEAGNFTWHGFSIDFPGYTGPETIVLLVSNVDSETGKAVGARIDLGDDAEPDFSLDSEEIQSILASCEFQY